MYGMYRWPLCMIVQIKPGGFVDPTWHSCCAYVTGSSITPLQHTHLS